MGSHGRLHLGEKWSDSGCVLSVAIRVFCRAGCEVERMAAVKDDSRVSSLVMGK